MAGGKLKKLVRNTRSNARKASRLNYKTQNTALKNKVSRLKTYVKHFPNDVQASTRLHDLIGRLNGSIS